MDKVVTVLKWMVELRCFSSCGLFPPNATAFFIAHFFSNIENIVILISSLDYRDLNV